MPESGAHPFDYDDMLKNDKILIRGNDQAEEIFGWRFEIGDEVTLHYWDGKEKTKTYQWQDDR